MKKIRLVCGTRASREDFFKTSALGRSIAVYAHSPGIELQLFSANTSALSVIYNQAIEAALIDPAILVFIHDDVHLIDFYWQEKIRQSLERFDIVGLAGNIRRTGKQPSWAFILNDQGIPEWDKPENLSGIVGHGSGFPCTSLSVFGPPGQECKLLDGLMVIIDSQTLARHNLRFDPKFAFHFYDMDFCRQAEILGLHMGTWPICTVHESKGTAFGTEVWQQTYLEYLEKYST